MRLGALRRRRRPWPRPPCRLETEPGVVDNARDVGDQGDTAVSHDRRARRRSHLLDGGVHRLDDDLLRAPNFIHQESEAAAGPDRNTRM